MNEPGGNMNVVDVEHGSIVHSPENGTSLMTIISLTCSSIGIILSGAALTLLLLTAYLFQEWRQKYKNQLLIQFMISRFLYTLIRYLYGIKNAFSLCINEDCIIYLDVLAMVYTEMVLVTWMFIFSRHMYECLAKVFVAEVPKIWTVSVSAWIIPGCISFVYHILFQLQSDQDLSYFFFYLVVLKWPVLIANAVMLILVLKSILKTNLNKKINNVRIIIVMTALIFVFCFQQVLVDTFKILHVVFVEQNNSVSSYVLIICNILLFYHCAFSIIFWVFGNEKTRNLWKSYCQKSTKTNASTIAAHDQITTK